MLNKSDRFVRTEPLHAPTAQPRGHLPRYDLHTGGQQS